MGSVHTGPWAWQATHGSGWQIGTATTTMIVHLPKILLDLPLENAEYCVGARGSMIQTTYAVLTATGTLLMIWGATWDFVAPGVQSKLLESAWLVGRNQVDVVNTESDNGGARTGTRERGQLAGLVLSQVMTSFLGCSG